MKLTFHVVMRACKVLMVGWKFVFGNVSYKSISFSLHVVAIGVTYINLASLSEIWTSVWTTWVTALIFSVCFHFSAHVGYDKGGCSTIIFLL